MNNQEKLEVINQEIEKSYFRRNSVNKLNQHPNYLSDLYNIRQHLLNEPDPENRGPNTHYRFRNVLPNSLKITPNGNAITIEFEEYE